MWMAQNRERVLQRWNSHRVATEGDLNDDRDAQEQASQIQKINARLELPRAPKATTWQAFLGESLRRV